MLDSLLLFMKERNTIEGFLSWQHARALQPLKELCVVENGKAKYAEVSLTDELSGEEAGRLIYTLGPRTKEMEEQGDPYIMEEYIVLNGGDEITLRMDKEFGQYSDWNNNFQAMTDSGCCIVTEVANRLAFGMDLEGRSVKARLSVFPMSFSVRGDGDNPFEGFLDLFSGPTPEDGFTMPCIQSTRSFFTTFNATIGDCRKVVVKEGGPLSFYIITLKTGFGTVPMAVEEETFEEKNLEPGKVLDVDGRIVAEMLEP